MIARLSDLWGAFMIWMATTVDELELPICVAGSSSELARMLGLTKGTVASYESKRRNGNFLFGKKAKYKIFKIEEGAELE